MSTDPYVDVRLYMKGGGPESGSLRRSELNCLQEAWRYRSGGTFTIATADSTFEIDPSDIASISAFKD